MLNDVKHQFLPILPDTLRGTYLGQTSPDSPSLLWAEVKGEVLLVLVELAEVLPLLLVRDGQHTRNGLADSVAERVSGFTYAQTETSEIDAHLGELRRGATGDLLHAERQELVLQLQQLLRQIIVGPGVAISMQVLCKDDCMRTWTEARRP